MNHTSANSSICWKSGAAPPGASAPLAARRQAQGLPGAEAAQLALQTLQGLAFAHDAGVAHHDLQSFVLLVSDCGHLRVAGLGVASGMEPEVAAVGAPGHSGGELDAASAPARDTSALGVQRQAAVRDVLCCGVLMHGLLAGPPALDEPDVGRVVARVELHRAASFG